MIICKRLTTLDDHLLEAVPTGWSFTRGCSLRNTNNKKSHLPFPVTRGTWVTEQNDLVTNIYLAYFSLCLRFLWFLNAFLVRQNFEQISQKYPGDSTWDASMCSYMFVFTLDVFKQSQHCQNPSSVFLILEWIAMSRSKGRCIQKIYSLNFCYTEINSFLLCHMMVLFHVAHNILFWGEHSFAKGTLPRSLPCCWLFTGRRLRCNCLQDLYRLCWHIRGRRWA